MNETAPSETRALLVAPRARPRLRAIRLFILLIFCLGFVSLLAMHFIPGIASYMGQASPSDLSDMKAKIDSLSNRVTDLEGEVSTLHDRLSSVSQAPPTPVAAPVSVPVASAVSSVDITKLQADVVAISTALATQQTLIKQTEAASDLSRQTTALMLAAAVDFMQLHDAALSGHGFEKELHDLRAVATNDPILQDELGKLEVYAKNGAPTIAQLHEELLEREPGALHATQKAEAHEWWERLWVEIKGLVSVRPLHGGESGAFGVMENGLTDGDTSITLDNFSSLPVDAQRYLADWKGKLEARHAIDGSLHALAARFTTLTQAQP